jgi:phage tail tape-measure protein
MAEESIRQRADTPEGELERKEIIAQGEGQALETAVAAVAGAAVGSLAGPIGIAAGAAIGAATGALLGREIRRQSHEDAVHDRDLDALNIELEDEPVELPSSPPPRSIKELQAELDAPRR